MSQRLAARLPEGLRRLRASELVLPLLDHALRGRRRARAQMVVEIAAVVVAVAIVDLVMVMVVVMPAAMVDIEVVEKAEPAEIAETVRVVGIVSIGGIFALVRGASGESRGQQHCGERSSNDPHIDAVRFEAYANEDSPGGPSLNTRSRNCVADRPTSHHEAREVGGRSSC
jgi:hypothetical protein